tara:strand:- start:85 stop:594 length:510 start_codon:yes stop_codon:yes gene_type:complete
MTLFFFGGDNYLSNWYVTEVKLTFDDTDYVFQNVEQAMMAGKAKLFEDAESFQKILRTPNPKSVKALGRKVKNFNPEVWDKYKKFIVKQAVWSKFLYNSDIREKLLATGEAYIAEDSKYDKIWGIGPCTLKQKENKTWSGQNLLGEILMEVRFDLRNLIQEQNELDKTK